MTRKIYNQITDIVNGLTVNEISMHQIKNNYETQGFALVLDADVFVFSNDSKKFHF